MRKNRILDRQAKYIVSSRTVNLKKVFLKKHHQRDFKEMVKSAAQRFCFTWDHLIFTASGFQMDIQPKDGYKLSKIMQFILGCFAQRFNKTYKLWGHFWGDRFVSTIVDSDEQLKKSIELNKCFKQELIKLDTIVSPFCFEIEKPLHKLSPFYRVVMEIVPMSPYLLPKDFKIKEISRIIDS
jgi:hypothetical protein